MNFFRVRLGYSVITIAGVAAVASAGGGMTYDYDGRFITLDSETAWFDQDGELRGHQAFQNVSPPAGFGHWDVQEENDTPHVPLYGTQDSFATESEISATGMVSGSSRPEDGIDYLIYAGVGLSVAYFDFSITEQTSFELYADLFSDPLAGESSVFLRGINGTGFEFFVNVQGGQTTVDEEITLEVGSYRFSLSSEIYLDPIKSDNTGSFDGGLRVVPAPGASAVLIGFGLLAGARRRR